MLVIVSRFIQVTEFNFAVLRAVVLLARDSDLRARRHLVNAQILCFSSSSYRPNSRRIFIWRHSILPIEYVGSENCCCYRCK